MTRLVIAAGAFTLAEWLRGYVFTGFPWLALGYTQVPDGLVPGYAPVGGVYLVTLVMALIAGFAARMAHALAQRTSRAVAAPLAGIAVLVLGDVGLSRIEWTAPSGAPVAVSLVQGNVLQDIKFDRSFAW
jgi:apolipoprotein N-acyltransferase